MNKKTVLKNATNKYKGKGGFPMSSPGLLAPTAPVTGPGVSTNQWSSLPQAIASSPQTISDALQQRKPFPGNPPLLTPSPLNIVAPAAGIKPQVTSPTNPPIASPTKKSTPILKKLLKK